MLIVVVGDVRSLEKVREKVLVVICGVVIGLGPTINGMTLKNLEDEASAAAGRNVFFIGAVSLLLFPPICYKVALMHRALPDSEVRGERRGGHRVFRSPAWKLTPLRRRRS